MKEEYLCMLKVGKLYISCLSVDSYDSEIKISFTSIINEAKKFNVNDIELFKSMLEMLMESTFNIITEVKESKGE